MCGITGVYEYGRAVGAVDEHVLVRMREAIHHRGPDGEGLYVAPDRRVGFGHRRLSIVDPVGGAQPMFSESGAVLIFNGEIYNYPALRRQLEQEGVRFRTTCDSEVILTLYDRVGEHCVEQLNGMFAFAIWDPRRRRLMMARDRVGEKPLYWADADGRLVFGSEIKALLEHPAVTPRVNDNALSGYLANYVTSPPETLYGGICKMPAGTIALCDEAGMTVRSYWSITEPRRFEGPSFAESTDRVREMLDRSVHDRLMADVPVGVLLSGGLDSTTLVALLRERTAGLSTFSVGFSDSASTDERAQARRVARHYGTDHHEIALTEKDAIDFLPKLVYHQDEPLADPVCIPLSFVCGLAREHGVPVVLAGEGADELFWGYPRYRQIMNRWPWVSGLLRLPPWMRSRVGRALPESKRPNMRQFLDGVSSGRPWPLHYPLGLSNYDRNRVLGERAGAAPWWLGEARSAPAGDALSTLAFDTQEYEFGLRLPELLLMRIDRFSMAHSVEARVPFLDPALVEFVYRLPLEQRLSDGVTKRVLREAVRDIVPEWVINRPKQGFGAPISSWTTSKLGTLLPSLMNQPGIRSHFDRDGLASVLADHRSGRADNAWILWPIVNFALWHRYWIEGESLDTLVDQLSATAVGA